MHMANELLSVPVATGTIGVAVVGLGYVCRKVQQSVKPERFALMGIMGAFVFAAQMVNIQLPMMPGTSGHMVGAVLLAIILGPHAGVLVLSSVVIVQCLIFQDGGLLALGCNLINMAIVPGYTGYYIYRTIISEGAFNRGRLYLAVVIACIAGLELGAGLVVLQTRLSGVLSVPMSTFLVTMLGVHLLVGLVEGLITAAVLEYIREVRPGVIKDILPGHERFSQMGLIASLAVITLLVAGGLSLLASGSPDGLEWSYAERPDDSGFESIVVNENSSVEAVENFQSRYAPLPDYSIRSEAEVSAGWTSFAGVLGSALTMGLVWLAARLLRRKRQLEPGV